MAKRFPDVVTLTVCDRNYNEYLFEDINKKPCELCFKNVSPVKHGLFHNDIIYFKNNKIERVVSQVRTSTISGVLVLNTFHGKFKDSFIYKFVPYDKELPVFLVAYKNKNLSSFDKSVKEVYAVIKFSKWDKKHPEGTIVNVIGDVRNQHHFYVYLLYARNLFLGIKKFNDCVFKQLTDNDPSQSSDESIIQTICKKPAYCIKDRSGVECYTIDGVNTEDYDDAFSVQEPYSEFNPTEYTKLSIYISNVPIVLDALSLWEKMTDRYCTVYLPETKQPMYPSILTGCLTSLTHNTQRIVFAIDVYIQGNDGGIVGVEYENALICVNQNYTYAKVNEFLENNNPYFVRLSNIVKVIKPQISHVNNITNFCNTDTVLSSYEIIEILMTFANTSIAKALYSKRKGIYREQYKKQVMPKSREERMQAYESINKKLEKYDETARRFLCEEYTTRGEYTTHLPDTQENIYVHATSPIRRIVDTVNISLMNSCIGCVMLPEWHDFLYKIENNIRKVNEYQRLSKKVERECDVLAKTQNLISYNQDDEKTHTTQQLVVEVDGIVFNKQQTKYSVYIPKLKTSCVVVATDQNMDEYSMYQFTLYYIRNEHSVKQKIQLELKERK